MILRAARPHVEREGVIAEPVGELRRCRLELDAHDSRDRSALSRPGSGVGSGHSMKKGSHGRDAASSRPAMRHATSCAGRHACASRRRSSSPRRSAVAPRSLGRTAQPSGLQRDRPRCRRPSDRRRSRRASSSSTTAMSSTVGVAERNDPVGRAPARMTTALVRRRGRALPRAAVRQSQGRRTASRT